MTEIQDCTKCDRTYEVTSDTGFLCVDCRKQPEQPVDCTRLVEFRKDGKYAYFDVVDGVGVFGGDLPTDEAASVFVEQVKSLLPSISPKRESAQPVELGTLGMLEMPERDQTRPSEEQGVFRKFVVRRVDGSDQPGGRHHGCEYFVLDVVHDQHAKAALAAYAESCKDSHPALSKDMKERYELHGHGIIEAVQIEYYKRGWKECEATKRELSWEDDDLLKAAQAAYDLLDSRHSDTDFDMDNELASVHASLGCAIHNCGTKAARNGERPDKKANAEAIRLAAIEEVATHYHGALADFWSEQGAEERLAGVAEKHHERAAVHRTYAREIRNQVWNKPPSPDDHWRKASDE